MARFRHLLVLLVSLVGVLAQHFGYYYSTTPESTEWTTDSTTPESTEWSTDVSTTSPAWLTTRPYVTGYVCPDAWTVYHGQCYLYIDHPYSWSEAECRRRLWAMLKAWPTDASDTERHTCFSLGAYLVEPRNDAENNFVAHMYHLHGAAYGWIGANDFAVEGEFVWASDQSAPAYTHWASGEPNNSGDQDCAEIYTDSGLWNDKECVRSNHDHPGFICEQAGIPVSIVGK